MSRGPQNFELPGERARIVLCGYLMLGVVLTIAGRLAYLQLGPRDARGEATTPGFVRAEDQPAQRARIVAAGGELLAWDRRVYDAMAEVYLVTEDDGRRLADPPALDHLVYDLARALELDLEVKRKHSGQGGVARVLAQRVERRMPSRMARLQREIAEAKARNDKVMPKLVRLDFPVVSGVTEAAALLALREIDPRTRTKKNPRPYTAYVHVDQRYEREYADRELLAGLVGVVEKKFERSGIRRVGRAGIERLHIAGPREAGARASRSDARGRGYWDAAGSDPAAPLTLRTTIDHDLQKRAQSYLENVAVRSVIERYGSPPEWGGMVVVDVPTGSIRAMASFNQDPAVKDEPAHRWASAFVPTQFAFEPGSVVKPLLIGMGLQREQISWNETVDCRSLRMPLGQPGGPRAIRDSHPCGDLTPRGVLINSSNIGAVRLAMRLGPQGLEDYLQVYGLRSALGLPLPECAHRIQPPKPIPQMHIREREIYTGPSLCYGYGVQATIGHLARAYLTFLSGRPRELRLIDAIEVDGDLRRIPVADAGTTPFLSSASIGRVKEALVALVDGAEGSTAPRLTQMLRTMGAPLGVIGGKTGTSEYPSGDGVECRTASFVGFAPAADPQLLAICVIQKKGAGSFYGGSYAAPAVGRVLLDALGRQQNRQLGAGPVRDARSGLTAQSPR